MYKCKAAPIPISGDAEVINSLIRKILCPKNIGDNCEVDIDECAPKPCVNGECEDGIAEFTCICNKGYEGPLCDIEIDECERYDPCVHGTCTGKTTYYTQNGCISIFYNLISN